VAEFGTDTRPEAAQLDEVERTLRTAVHDRLESEVPLGAFLSGGIDSGLVVSFMAEASAGRLITATVGFAEAAHNELDAARVTASAFRTQHHEEVVAPRLDEVFDEIVTRFGEPMADSSAIPTWYVSRSARAHVTVALSGDGGDETFGGYDFRYVPHVREAQVRRLVAGTPGRRLARWMAAHWPRARALPRPLRLGGVLENLSRDPASAYYLDLCFLKPHQTARLLGRPDPGEVSESPVYAAVTEPYRRCPSPHALQRAQYADLHVYMPNDPLVKVDRMSMAHSLEVRSPMLDRRVVELAFRLPATRHVRRGTGKVLLRSLAGRRLPPALASLPKRGFTVPIGEWIAGPYGRVFADEVLGSGSRVASLVDRAVLRRMLDAIGPDTPREAFALWAVWLLERWLRTQTAGVGQSGARAVALEQQRSEAGTGAKAAH
jgi:asparagine synthase (glutamine-hydrolysing)